MDSDSSTTNEPPAEEMSSREEVLETLQKDDRDIVEDADRLDQVNWNCIEARHEADDGEVIVQLMPHVAWELDDSSDEDCRMLPDEETQELTTYTLPGNIDDDDERAPLDISLDDLDCRLEELHVVTDNEKGVAAVVRGEGDSRAERSRNALERADEEPGRWVYDGSLDDFLAQILNGLDFVEMY